MAEWFECKVQYESVGEDHTKKGGKPKVYLVDAVSFTEAEARVIEEVRCMASGDVNVKAVKRTRINEIFYHEGGENWYLVKVAYISIDEKSAVEKRSISHTLVQATDFKEAFENFNEGMKGTLGDFDIVSISETPLMDVFKMKVVD